MKKTLNLLLIALFITTSFNYSVYADDTKVETIDINTVQKLIDGLDKEIKFIESKLDIERGTLEAKNNYTAFAFPVVLTSVIVGMTSSGVLFLYGAPTVLVGGEILLARGLVNRQLVAGVLENWHCFSMFISIAEAEKISNAMALLFVVTGSTLALPSTIITTGILFGDHMIDDRTTESTLQTFYENLAKETKPKQSFKIIGNEGDFALLVETKNGLDKQIASIIKSYNELRYTAEANWQRNLDKISSDDENGPDFHWYKLGVDKIAYSQESERLTTSQITVLNMEKKDLEALLSELKRLKILLEKAVNGGLEHPLNLDPKSVDEFYRNQVIKEEMKKYQAVKDQQDSDPNATTQQIDEPNGNNNDEQKDK